MSLVTPLLKRTALKGMRKTASPSNDRATTASPSPAGYAAGFPRYLQRHCGDTSKCDMGATAGLHGPIAVSNPGDALELEADQVADQVMRMPATQLQRQRAESANIHRIAGASRGQTGAAPAASVDQAVASPARPLEPALRQDMEQRFGHDFSQVRLHTGTVAEQSARDVNAQAYTVGHNIVFGAGRFAPESHDGRRLLAHELAHTIQQPEGISRKPFGSRPAWASIPIDYEMIPDPIERMEMMRADYEKYRWKNALERLDKGELEDSDLSYDLLRNRLTGLKSSEVSTLIGKISAFQTQRDKDINDPNVKDQEKKRPISTAKIIQWLEVRKTISTPMPENATVNSLLPGMIDSYSISINDIEITVVPDKGGASGNETKPTSNFTGNFTWLKVGGKITDLKKNGTPFNPTKLEVTIVTQYKNSPDDTSGYGKGTTESDKYNETTTLRVHEGQHGTDFIDYLTNTPPPVSLKDGINGKLTPAQFSKILNYVKDITKDTCETTDQSGFSQDEFLKTPQGAASGIASCRKP